MVVEVPFIHILLPKANGTQKISLFIYLEQKQSFGEVSKNWENFNFGHILTPTHRALKLQLNWIFSQKGIFRAYLWSSGCGKIFSSNGTADFEISGWVEVPKRALIRVFSPFKPLPCRTPGEISALGLFMVGFQTSITYHLAQILRCLTKCTMVLLAAPTISKVC